MRFDFTNVSQDQDLSSVPEGSYLCEVVEVRAGHSRNGSPRWRFRLQVADGEYAGKTAAWDSITWSERGAHRVQHVLGTLGLDVTGVIEVEPGDLEGRRAVVQVAPESWENPTTGELRTSNQVPYLGYQPAPARNGRDGARVAEEAASGKGEPLPF